MHFNTNNEVMFEKFVCYRIKDAQLFWRANGLLEDVDDQKFLDSFAYSTFDNLIPPEKIDANLRKDFYAERYGGKGIGDHGGGARTGCSFSFQVKGTGCNNLVAQSGCEWHRTGSLNLVDAMMESAYTAIINKLFPIGAVPIYGIILTGATSAFADWGKKESDRGWGALLIRQHCSRPASFMPAPNFHGKGLFWSDYTRARYANRLIASSFKSTSDFISYFGQYLLNYAKQFAFARTLRIMHGSISPSNIEISGKWLDVGNSTFLPARHNYKIGADAPSSAEEVDAVIDLIKSFLYFYEKYNGIKINTSPLISYFYDQLHTFSEAYSLYLIGFDRQDIALVKSHNDVSVLYNFFEALYKNSKKLLYESPTWIEDDDPYVCFAYKVAKYFSGNTFNATLNCEIYTNIKLMHSIDSIFKTGYLNVQIECSFLDYCHALTLVILKRSFLREIFFKGRIQQDFHKISTSQDPLEQAYKFEEYLSVTNWFHDGIKKNELTLLSNKNYEIAFNLTEGNYIFIKKICKEKIKFREFSSLKEAINEKYSLLLAESYDPKRYIDHIEKIDNIYIK